MNVLLKILGLALLATSHFSMSSELSKKEMFLKSESVKPYQLYNSGWNCETHLTLNQQTVQDKNIFFFKSVLHNHYMLYSRSKGGLPLWFPAWFSFQSTMETTIKFKTKDFNLMDKCQEFIQCLEDGDTRENMAFIRVYDRQYLSIEWTTDKMSNGLKPAVSDTNQFGFAYSVCEMN